MNLYIFNSKYKLALRVIVFSIILVLLLNLIEKIVFKFAIRSKTGQSGKIAMIANHTIDTEIPIFGSSVALVHFNPNVVTNITGLDTYNFGMDGNSFQQYGGLVEEFCSYTQAKHIILASSIGEFGDRSLLYNPQFYIPFIRNKYVSSYFSEIDQRSTALLEFLPGYSLTFFSADYYKEIYKAQNYTGDPLKGFSPRNIQWENKTEIEKDTTKLINAEVDLTAILMLEAAVKKINNKNIRVIFILAPIYIQGQEQIMNLNEIRNIYKQLAGEKNIFLDFTTSDICLNKKLFYNNTHLNAKGADLLSKEFSKKLIELNIKSD